MEDLISAISGNMHVSQDGYDIKALQEYLAATISLPHLSLGPTNAFRPPSSRSASSTRKHLAHVHSYMPETHVSSIASSSTSHAPYPSPGVFPGNGGYWGSADDVAMATPQRPNTLRRTSSYGFGGAKEYVPLTPAQQDTYSAFQEDAFAPLYQGTGLQPAPAVDGQNPWAGFTGASSAFGYRQPQSDVARLGVGVAQDRGRQLFQPPSQGSQIPGTEEEEEDEAMDEEWTDQSMDEIDDEDNVDEGLGSMEEQNHGTVRNDYGGWVGAARHQV